MRVLLVMLAVLSSSACKNESSDAIERWEGMERSGEIERVLKSSRDASARLIRAVAEQNGCASTCITEGRCDSLAGGGMCAATIDGHCAQSAACQIDKRCTARAACE